MNLKLPVSVSIEVTDAEGIAFSPSKKRAEVIDTERILMGEALTDLEINLVSMNLSQLCCKKKAPRPQKSREISCK